MSVVVLGSANLDLVYRVERIPRPGETLLASGSDSVPGGKGNNQAVASARAGAPTTFVVSLGTDAAGDTLAAEAAAAGVTLLARRVDTRTGTALIVVDRHGENTIVVDAAANSALVDLTTAEHRAISAASTLVLQLETPLETVVAAATAATDAGTLVVLNASPVGPLPHALLGGVDVLIVNEHEAAFLTEGATAIDAIVAALLELVPAVIVTLGGRGSLVGARGQQPLVIPAFSVEVVDTTGAGDTFCGAFAAELDRHLGSARPDSDEAPGRPARASRVPLDALATAARFATRAAAISVQRPGAVPSIPTFEEIRDFRADD